MSDTARAQEALLTILKERPNLNSTEVTGDIYTRLARTCPLCLRSNDGADARGDNIIYADEDHPVGWYCIECDDIVEVLFN